MRRRSILAAVLPFAVLACGGPAEQPVTPAEQNAEDVRVAQNNGVSPAIAEKVAVEDSAIPALEAFKADRTPDIAGAAVTCSFKLDGAALLIAALEPQANARGKGLIQIGGVERVLTGTEAKGAAGMRAGPTMTDGEFTVNVVRATGAGDSEAGAREWPATLVSRMNMANERRYGPGVWTCSK